MAGGSKSKKTSARSKTAARARGTTTLRRSAGPTAPVAATAAIPNGKGTPAPSNKAVLTQREQLEKERAQVAAELELLRAELLESPEPTGDEVDLNVYEREKTLGLVSAYKRRLEEIDAALRATERGQYGICERCGQPIDPERLKIFPEARMCVKCKNQVEKEARRLAK